MAKTKNAGNKRGAKKNAKAAAKGKGRGPAQPKGRTSTRKSKRPSEQTFPELGDLKDAIAMRHAKAYADEMHEAAEATARAEVAKQAIRSRMKVIKASFFSGHGYEYTLIPGDEKFTARKTTRGAKPPDTAPGVPETPAPDFDTDPDGRPLDEDAGDQ